MTALDSRDWWVCWWCKAPATFFGRTIAAPPEPHWAFMCNSHRKKYAVGEGADRGYTLPIVS